MSEWRRASELAGLPGLPSSARGVRLRAERECWTARPARGRTGGGGVEYHVRSLPQQAREQLALQQGCNARCSEVADAARSEVARVVIAETIERARGESRRESALARAAHVEGKQRRMIEARAEILDALERFRKRGGLSLRKAMPAFARAYNGREIDLGNEVYETVAGVSVASLTRWRTARKKDGITGLASRHGRHRVGTSLIDSQEQLRDFFIAMLTDHPHATNRHLRRAALARFGDSELTLPKERAIAAWRRKWTERNGQAFEAVTNPDAWKSKRMSAFGSASERVTRLNHLWEFDSTPADVMLKDGRYSLVGVVDVYSRRARLLVSRTSRATAIASLIRLAIIDWGVPEIAKTDNGSDYKSFHIRRAFEELGVRQEFCTPFAAWEKPHIERFFRTFSHGLLELLPNYIGHDVASRKAIESRRSFAERLFEKGGAVEIDMTREELQNFCDNWTASIYHHEPHSGLAGRTPTQVVGACTDEVRRVRNERALDILLAAAPGDGWRTVTKKGIRIDKMHYVSPELAMHVGERVRVLYDDADVGRVFVFGDVGEAAPAFLCIAECPEVTGVSRREIAARARAKQRETVQAQRKALKDAARRHGTREIAREILASREEGSASVVPFRSRESEYESAGIEAAQDALDALLERTREPEPADVDEAAQARVVALLAGERESEPEETGDERFERWLALQDLPPEQWSAEQRDWAEVYEQTSEFRAQRMLHESLGPGSSAKEGA